MKYLLDATRMAFISLECLFILIVYFTNQTHPQFFAILGDSITSDTEVTKWLPVIPLALSVYCFVDLIWKLITPLSSNKKLYDWPDFWRLQMRCYFSLFLTVICATVACIVWIFSKKLTHNCTGILFTLSMGLSLITAGCMVFASLTLRMIMEKNSKSDSAN